MEGVILGPEASILSPCCTCNGALGVGGEGGLGGTWVNFCWVCAAGLPEPYPIIVYSCGQLWTPS